MLEIFQDSDPVNNHRTNCPYYSPWISDSQTLSTRPSCLRQLQINVIPTSQSLFGICKDSRVFLLCFTTTEKMLYIFHHIFEPIFGLLAAKSRSGLTDLLKENTKECRNAYDRSECTR
jgi:hypothetical protein